MGVFAFYNYDADTSREESILKSKGHKNVRRISFGDYTLLTTNKVLVNNKNLIEKENGLIAGYGTYFYHKKISVDALEDIWKDIDINTCTLPDEIYGHYGIIVKKCDSIVIFNDRSGSYRLYITQDGNKVCITSSMLCAISSVENPHFDNAGLASFLSGKYFSEVPFVEGVMDFNTFKYASFSGGEFCLKDKKQEEDPRVINSMDEAVAYVTELIDNQIDQLSAIRDKELSAELTGGFDSRIIACMLERGHFLYDFVTFPTWGPDEEVSKKVSKLANKRLIIYKNPSLGNDMERESIGEFDLGFNFYRHYPSIRSENPHDYEFSGLFGECLANETDMIPFFQKNSYLHEVVEALMSSKITNSITEEKRIRKMINSFEGIGIDGTKALTNREIEIIQREAMAKFGGDCMWVSAENSLIYFYSMFNEWHFVNGVSNISQDVKSERKLSIAMIKALNHKFSDMPFNSRLRNPFPSLNNIDRVPYEKSYNWLKDAMPRWALNIVYGRVGRCFAKSKRSKIDFSFYENAVNVQLLKKYPNVHYIIMQRIYSLEILRHYFDIKRSSL